MFEEAMAELEGADRALAFTSGMAALAAVAKLVTVGEHIVAGDDIYGGTSRLLAQVERACCTQSCCTPTAGWVGAASMCPAGV